MLDFRHSRSTTLRPVYDSCRSLAEGATNVTLNSEVSPWMLASGGIWRIVPDGTWFKTGGDPIVTKKAKD